MSVVNSQERKKYKNKTGNTRSQEDKESNETIYDDDDNDGDDDDDNDDDDDDGDGDKKKQWQQWMVRREQSRVELNRGECHKVQHRAAELRKVEQSGVLQILLQ